MEQPLRAWFRCYLDEALSEDLAIVLKGLGHDAVHTRAVGHAHQIDPKQLAFAKQQDRVVVTANHTDFRMLHEAWLVWAPLMNDAERRSHPGILVVPNPNVMPLDAMARAIDTFARAADPRDVQDRLMRWRDGRGWEDMSAVR